MVAHHEEVEQADDDTDGSHDDVQKAHAVRYRTVCVDLLATEHHGHGAGE